MPGTQPIQYTSRTFNTILNDINSDPELVDKPNWFKRIWAGVGDVLSMYINATANQSYLRTAFTRRAVAELCRLIDYEISSHSTSSGTLIFYFDADAVVYPKTVLVADVAALYQGSLSVSAKRFEGRVGTVMAATSEGFTTNFAVDNNLDVARNYMTGEKVRVSTDNTLPSPLVAGTDYYVIRISATEIRLATSIANAYAGTEITLTSNGVGNHTVTLHSFQSTGYQQTTADQAIIGTSDGSSEWQEFDIPDAYILPDTLEITINSVTWTKVDSLINSGAVDTHYVHRFNADGASFIQFGNGTYGAIPGNFDIHADYAYGGGSDTNISNLNKINVYAGGDTDIIGVSNATTFTGGSDEENIDSAKVLAPLLLKARDRFVTTADGEALALAYSGVERAKVNKNVYGLLSCQVPIVPSGGGLPAGALKTALQTYLIDRTVMESIDVRVEDPTYNAVSITASIKISPGYVFANIKPYITLALRLMFSEQTYEFYNDYLQNGISSFISNVNTKWSYTFSITDNSQLQTLIENVEPADFGVDYQESDVLAYVQTYVGGVDYMLIAAPVFPITQLDDEITTDNINPVLITEIP